MKITVELDEEEKRQLRERENEIMAVIEKIDESDLVGRAKAANYEIPELKSAMDSLFRARDKLMYLTELDIVDNDA